MDLFGRDSADTQPLIRLEWMNVYNMLYEKNKAVAD